MNTFKNIFLPICLLFCLVSLKAQEKDPAITNLMQLEGHWEGDTKAVLSNGTFTIPFHADFKKTADGSGLLMEEWFKFPEIGNMMGTSLIGFNPNDKKIHWFSINNFETAHDHIGYWKSPDNFYMVANEMIDNKKYKEEINLIFKDPSTLEFSLKSTKDGKDFEKLNATFKKVETCSGQ